MANAPEPGSTPDLAALEAAAAQAEAEAAEAAAAAAAAKAAAAKAALEAAKAGAGQAAPAPEEDTAPLAEPAPPAGAAPAAADPAPGAPAGARPELSGWARTVFEGYQFKGEMLTLGALVEDGEANPAVQVGLPLSMMNRHGLVAGATGTGKTKTLQVMTEALSNAGVPVFVADIKGDLSGLAVEGQGNEKLLQRTASIGQDWQARSHPVEFYTLGGQGTGIPIRTTVTDFGPLLLSKVLGLNDTQESSLGLIFHWADSQGLALLDLKDLQQTISFLVSEEGKDELKGIGGLSAATAGVILREIVALKAQGADVFFGEPAFSTSDLMRTTADGRGVISALELPAVQDRPALFSTFIMWLLADLFSELPEVGDLPKPKLVFFFDEAHLLFTGASKDFLTQVTQTVRLIRSKGVGVFFVTQSPKDVPADVLAQLGNRVQHALRAFTPDDATALRAAARTFPKSDYDLERLLQELGTGEAITTVLTEKGAPTPVAWTRMRAPQSSMDPAPESVLAQAVAASPNAARYAEAVDNESAYELLTARMEDAEKAKAEAAAAAEKAKADAIAAKEAEKAAAAAAKEAERKAREEAREAERLKKERERAATKRKTTASKGVESLLRSVGTQLGREITRSVFGTRKR